MIVFTYPGQGSQWPGMGTEWADHPSWELVTEASEASDRDVARLLLYADAEELTETRNAQLATFVLSMVTLDAVSRVGVESAGHAGHSLGEYSALTASGALDFGDATRLVTERGNAMQAAADEKPGSMSAILGLDDDRVEIACARAVGDVWVANYNGPGQVVIAGTSEAVEAAILVAKELGATRSISLAVGGAFHTPLMGSARDRLAKAIDQIEIRNTETTVVANVDAASHPNGDDWADLLNAQLCSPVRWRQSLHTLADLGFTTFVELGPGSALSSMTKRTIDGSHTLSVGCPDDLDSLLETLAGPPASEVGLLEGEHLFAIERLVVSPVAGVFSRSDDLVEDEPIAAGDLVGRVGTTEVRSPFAGRMKGFLALEGERVSSSQPLAWLQVHQT